jgi:phenylacetate-coenzyme A ligase PaaK-like adenylate-forming protein
VHFLRQHKFVLSFLALLVFCSVMVIRRLDARKTRHIELIEDWQRTVVMVDPSSLQLSNAVWRYYWSVRKEMEHRGLDSIQRARKLAAEE